MMLITHHVNKSNLIVNSNQYLITKHLQKNGFTIECVYSIYSYFYKDFQIFI